MLGQPVAKQLIESGFDVTLFTTNKQKATAMFPNAKIAVGNLKDTNSIEAAMQGQEIVYLNLAIDPLAKHSDWNAEKGGMTNIIQAAKKRGFKE